MKHGLWFWFWVCFGLWLCVWLLPALLFAQDMTVSWTFAGKGQDGFVIERKEGSAGAAVKVGAVAANVFTYLDTAVTKGVEYCYQVAAFNSAGTGLFSAPACAQAGILGAPGSLTIVVSSPAQPELTVNWNAPPPPYKPTPRDWVALDKSANNCKDYVRGNTCGGKACWVYTNGAAKGTFIVPQPTGAGTYDVCYYENDGFTVKARSPGYWGVR